MARYKLENWDGVTAPSIPTGWTVDTQLVTGTTNTPTSAPNSLIYPVVNFNASPVPHASYNALQDSNNGNVTVSATVRFSNSSTGQKAVWVYGRSTVVVTSANFGSAGTYLYYAGIQRNGASPGLFLGKVVNGAGTTGVVSPIGNANIADATDYSIILALNGASQQVQCERLSDGFWMNSSGVFVSDPTGQTVAITASDTGVTAAPGYAGLGFYSADGTGGVYGADDWAFDTYTLNPNAPAAPAADTVYPVKVFYGGMPQ